MDGGGPSRTVGRFKLLDVLGEGGMGTVYLAHDSETGKKVALKLLLGGAGEGGHLVERFRREVLALTKLDHPNLARIFEAGGAGGPRLYYTMEVIKGRSLEKILKEKGPLPVKKVISITRNLADGVAHVHDTGIIHRDIKPANVLVDRTGKPILTDFGLVKVQGMASLTQSNTFLGTYQYASPEVLAGLKPDGRSDIYQIGLLCYIMLTGRLLPFGEKLEEIARKILVERLDPPSVIRPNIPMKLDYCVTKAIARDPENRYETAAELRDDLDLCLAELDRPKPVPAEAPLAETPMDRHFPSVRAMAVHLILLLAILSAVLSFHRGVTRTSPPELELPVAMAWLQSEWDALSFRLGAGKASPDVAILQECIRRMAWADGLLRAVNAELPVLLECDDLPSDDTIAFLLKAQPPVALERACREKDLDYESPVPTMIRTMLRHMALRLASLVVPDAPSQGKARQLLDEWRARLLAKPDLDWRLDRLLEPLELPGVGNLLLIGDSILRLQGTDLSSAERQKLLQSLRTVPEKAQHDNLFADIFGPLTGDLSPRAWVKQELRK